MECQISLQSRFELSNEGVHLAYVAMRIGLLPVLRLRVSNNKRQNAQGFVVTVVFAVEVGGILKYLQGSTVEPYQAIKQSLRLGRVKFHTVHIRQQSDLCNDLLFGLCRGQFSRIQFFLVVGILRLLPNDLFNEFEGGGVFEYFNGGVNFSVFEQSQGLAVQAVHVVKIDAGKFFGQHIEFLFLVVVLFLELFPLFLKVLRGYFGLIAFAADLGFFPFKTGLERAVGDVVIFLFGGVYYACFGEDEVYAELVVRAEFDVLKILVVHEFVAFFRQLDQKSISPGLFVGKSEPHLAVLVRELGRRTIKNDVGIGHGFFVGVLSPDRGVLNPFCLCGEGGGTKKECKPANASEGKKSSAAKRMDVFHNWK